MEAGGHKWQRKDSLWGDKLVLGGNNYLRNPLLIPLVLQVDALFSSFLRCFPPILSRRAKTLKGSSPRILVRVV